MPWRWKSFNETAPVKARKFHNQKADHAREMRFNETAPVKARKYWWMKRRSTWSACFNETAPVKARKYSVEFCNAVRKS